MKKLAERTAQAIYFSLAFFVFLQMNASAYIDPSATTYLVQAIAGVVIAIGAAFTIFRHKIIGFFKKNSKVEKKEIHFTEEDGKDETGEE